MSGGGAIRRSCLRPSTDGNPRWTRSRRRYRTASSVTDREPPSRSLRPDTQLFAFACTFGLGYGASFTLILTRAAQVHGHREDFASLQSCLAVGQYIGSFFGVLLTAQLRNLNADHSFVMSFALMPPLAAVNIVLCAFIFPKMRAARAEPSTR